MIIKSCQECGVKFQARSGATKNCSVKCGIIGSTKTKAAKYLARSGRTRSEATLKNDARQRAENHVPNMLLSRQLWNKKINLEVKV